MPHSHADGTVTDNSAPVDVVTEDPEAVETEEVVYEPGTEPDAEPKPAKKAAQRKSTAKKKT